jgi:hypothetical protein
LLDVDVKLNCPECHECTAVNEPPSRLSVFDNIEYSKKGFTIEKIDAIKMQQMCPFFGSSKMFVNLLMFQYTSSYISSNVNASNQ